MNWRLGLIIIGLILVLFNAKRSFAGTIIVNIDGIIPSKGGKIYTAIFTKQNFLKFGEQVFGNIQAVTTSGIQIVFDNVPEGSYGVASFQDSDGSEDLTKNFFGVPTEPMGFSRNPRIRFGPPAFEDVEITVGLKETVQITIQMK
jgi:uncharacterized protein (DUF2141 family)